MGWDCPTLFLAVWLCWLLSDSWNSPPRLKFHVCVHEPIQAIVRSRFCTLFPISLSISFFHPCHLPNEIDWYPAWHRLNANYIQGSPSGGPQPAAIMPGLTREISLFLAFHEKGRPEMERYWPILVFHRKGTSQSVEILPIKDVTVSIVVHRRHRRRSGFGLDILFYLLYRREDPFWSPFTSW